MIYVCETDILEPMFVTRKHNNDLIYILLLNEVSNETIHSPIIRYSNGQPAYN